MYHDYAQKQQAKMDAGGGGGMKAIAAGGLGGFVIGELAEYQQVGRIPTS